MAAWHTAKPSEKVLACRDKTFQLFVLVSSPVRGGNNGNGASVAATEHQSYETGRTQKAVAFNEHLHAFSTFTNSADIWQPGNFPCQPQNWKMDPKLNAFT